MVFSKQLNKLHLQNFGIVVFSQGFLWKNLHFCPCSFCLGHKLQKCWDDICAQVKFSNCTLGSPKPHWFRIFFFIAPLFWVCLILACCNLPVSLVSPTFILLHSANWINAFTIFIVLYWFDSTNLPLLTEISYFLWPQNSLTKCPSSPTFALTLHIKSQQWLKALKWIMLCPAGPVCLADFISTEGWGEGVG